MKLQELEDKLELKRKEWREAKEKKDTSKMFALELSGRALKLGIEKAKKRLSKHENLIFDDVEEIFTTWNYARMIHFEKLT